MNVRSYETGQDKKKGGKSGRNRKESPGKEVVVVCICNENIEKRGTLRRKEGDGNESTGEKEERNTLEKMVGHSE